MHCFLQKKKVYKKENPGDITFISLGFRLGLLKFQGTAILIVFNDGLGTLDFVAVLSFLPRSDSVLGTKYSPREKALMLPFQRRGKQK